MNLRHVLPCVLALVALTLGTASAADAPAYHEGNEYERVDTPSPPDPQHILVEEFFWYGCPHCSAAEPAVEKWLAAKPDDVTFVRVPNSLGRDIGVLHSKAFYAATMLGILDQVHKPMFDAIHTDHKAMGTPAEIAALFASVAKIDAASVESALGSFMVDGNVGRAESLARQYGITGTPMLVVDGHYRIKAMATPADMFKVADYLIGVARTARASAPAVPAAEPAAGTPAPAPAPAPTASAAPSPETSAPAAGGLPKPLLIGGGLLILVLVIFLIARSRRT